MGARGPSGAVSTDPAPLNFRLRAPVRLSWTSEPARELWAPRLAAARDALDAPEPGATLVAIRPDRARAIRDAAARAGLHVQTLTDDALGDQPQPAGGALITLAVGTRARIGAIVAAVIARDAHALAAASGLPACCITAAWRDSAFDPVWCAATPHAIGLTAELPCLPETNALLRPLGLRIAPVAACSASCAAMRAFGRARLDRLAASSPAGALLAEMLDWPARWSALHGIAETVTPVVRFTYGTRATRRCITVRS